MMSGRDRISQLPTEILDNILGLLPIVEAARTAVLSTIWRDCWSNLTQLNFNDQFFAYVRGKYSGSYNSTSTCMYVINKVLMRHHGPIRKFVLDFKGDVPINDEPNSRKFDFDEWFLFITQKGVEEMKITVNAPSEYFWLPNSIFSCSTLKKLDISEALVATRINAPFIFPNVTSLSFDKVVFGNIGSKLNCAIDIPMLETLSFSGCESASSFNIKAPRLGSLTLKNYCIEDDIDSYDPVVPYDLDLPLIHTLCLDFNFKFDAEISKSILREGLQSAAKMLKMLHTLKLRSFNGSRSELRFIMMLLACFPSLQKVVIVRRVKFDSSKEFKIMQMLLHFPRASKKAKIIYI